jgi:hypothetical protein
MAIFVSDTFTDTDAVAIGSHIGEIGAIWIAAPTYTGTAAIYNNRLTFGTGVPAFYASGAPSSADYTVKGDLYVASNATNAIFSVAGRMSSSVNTMYFGRYSNSAGAWQLFKIVSGIATQLGSNASQSLTVGQTYTVELILSGNSIVLKVDSTTIISVTDSSITAAGYAGFRSTMGSSTTGYHLDNFVASDLGVDPLDSQTITFGALASKTYGAAPITLTATASSGLPVYYTSSDTGVATVDGSTLTIVGVGPTNITASQAGDGTWAAATPVVQALTVAKADQTISISAPRYKLPTDGPFAVTATASSGLACTLSIVSGPATILNGTVTLAGSLGDVVIRAVQAGNANYNAATNTDRTVSVVDELPVFDAGGLALSLQLTI